MTSGSIRVVFHDDGQIGLKTRVKSGRATVGEDALSIDGAQSILIPYDAMSEVKLFRLHGLGRMIRIVHKDGELVLTPIRLNILGYFVIVDFFGAGRLVKALSAATHGSR